MARTNKYSSINFNEIYDKKFNSKSSSSSATTSSSQKNHLSTARSHGGMLVLTRPSPKPQPQIQIQPKPTSAVPSLTPSPSLPSSSSSSQIQPIPSSHDPDQTRFGPESISLRPLGRTGSSLSSSSSSSSSIVPIIQVKERDPPLSLPSSSSSSLHKPEPFVPPHLRPGFAGRQERFGPDGQKNLGLRGGGGGGGGGSREIGGHYGEDGRPKSGGYERIIQRSGESDQADMMMDRPSSSGNRPNSSGRYGSSSYRSSPPPSHHY